MIVEIAQGNPKEIRMSSKFQYLQHLLDFIHFGELIKRTPRLLAILILKYQSLIKNWDDCCIDSSHSELAGLVVSKDKKATASLPMSSIQTF